MLVHTRRFLLQRPAQLLDVYPYTLASSSSFACSLAWPLMSLPFAARLLVAEPEHSRLSLLRCLLLGLATCILTVYSYVSAAPYSRDMRPYAPEDRCVKYFTGHQHNFEKTLLKCAWSADGTARYQCLS